MTSFKKILLIVFLIAAAFLSYIVFGGKAKEKTVLKVAWMSWPKDSVDEIIKDFEALYPDIEIEMQQIPFPQLYSTLEVKLLGAEPPDVFIVDGPLTASYAYRGFLLNLDQYFDESEKSEWFTESLVEGSYRGSLYSVPYTSSSVGLFYNKDVFDKYDIPYLTEDPEHRLTWEEVMQIAKKLTLDTDNDKVIDQYGIMIEQVDRPYQILPFMQSKRAEVIGPDSLSVIGYIDSQSFIEAATFYGDIFNKYMVSPKGVTEGDKAREYFALNKVAMFLGAEWNIVQLSNMNIGMSPHPYFSGGEVVTPTGGWHVGISAKTKLVDAALAFTKYVTGETAVAKWFELFGSAPSLKGFYEKYSSGETVDNMFSTLVYEMEHTAKARPSTPAFLEYESGLKDALNSIMFGADPKKTLFEAAIAIEHDMAKYRNDEIVEKDNR